MKLNLKEELKTSLTFLKVFFKNPSLAITQSPRIHPLSAAIALGAITFLAGSVLSLFNFTFFFIFYAIFLSPLLNILFALLFTAVFFTSIVAMRNDYLSLKELTSLIIFAHIPYALLGQLRFIFSGFALVGFAVTSLLIVQGAHSQFGLSKRFLIRFQSLLFVAYGVVWVLMEIGS